MASVLLPTHRWTPSCAALARQLAPGDELLVLCDRPTDPVAAAPPTSSDGTVEVVPVGNPDGCSGKANALAVGLDRASDDLLVLTDDDVERDGDWLDRIKRLARRHGAASATPAFVSSSPRWQLFEPVMLTLGSALLCRYGGAWDGGVAFERERIDEARFRAGLKRTVSDDALLWSMLETVHTTPTFVSRVRVPGGRKQVRDRIVRFMLTYRYFLPRWMALTNQS
jgi:glycosyltransferase involved in cell wall biosynthesis